MSNLNNNANKRHSYERKSSRVTPKVREYLAEIANERELELERFMVLSSSSPASSVSVGAQSLRGNEVTMRSCSSSRSRSRCRSHSGTSGVGVTAATAAVAKRNPMTADEAQITNIPIVMVTATGPEEQPQEMPQKFNSVEDMRTPTKCTQTETPQRQTRKTQTPESALKSHKRLEWDPAADVGYRCERAVSTSNISTLERSVLEAATLQRNDGRSNHSESDLNRLKATAAPPLASSTFVNRSASSQAQVTPVPRTTPVASTNQSSRRGSCMTSAASSFDYQHHSRPSTAGTVSTAGSTSSKTSSRHTPQSAEELLRQMEEQRQEREYTAQLEQVLSRRRQMSREQNKENQQPKMNNSAMSIVSSSTSTSSSCAMGKNDVDLGIDLLCSLVNKRSLTNSQKKQLAKDIIKRLVGFELVSSRSSASSRQSHRREQAQQTDPNSQTDAQTKVQDMATNTSCRSSIILPRSPPEELRLTVPVPAPRTRRATPTESPRGEPSCSYSSSTSGASNELITQKSNLQAAKSTDTAAEQAAMQEWLNPLTQSEIEYEQKRQQRDNLSLERRTQIDWIDAEIRRLCALQNLLRCNVRGDFPADETQLTSPSHVQGQAKSGHAVPARGGHPAPPAPPVTPVSMPVKVAAVAATGVVAASSRAGSGGAGSSGGSGTASVAGGAAFGEGGVGETLAGAGGASAGTRRASSGAGGTLSGRAGDEATSVVAGANIAVVEGPGGSRTGGTSSGASSGTGGPGAAAGEASSGAQASSGSSSGAAPGTAAPPLPPPLPPLPPAAAARQLQQRSKMATPALSHSGSSESVCSFVQQRQRQFLAHYQNQQQQRREQQQQLLMLQQQQQLIHRQQQKRELPQQLHLHAACHMSHCHHHEQQQQQQQQHYVQMQYAQAVGNAYSCLDDGAVYYQVLNSQGATATVASATRATAAAAASAMATTVATAAAAAAGVTSNSCTGSNTSSSMLCLSSEMSIPMGGMLNACEATTTTTTTTTHQYDDVACQQLQLQLRQRRRQVKRVASLDVPQQQMLQIRPRGIAYVLQFAGNDNVGHVLHDCLTVQDYLQRARPQFCAQSKQRKAILNQMQLLRNARRRELDELIEGSSVETIDRRLQQLPPPVTSKVRIFSTKEMKAMTNKRCENLPEVLAAQHREREERRRRSNRLMRDVFNRRLQRRVRSGKLSLNHSRTVI